MVLHDDSENETRSNHSRFNQSKRSTQKIKIQTIIMQKERNCWVDMLFWTQIASEIFLFSKKSKYPFKIFDFHFFSRNIIVNNLGYLYFWEFHLVNSDFLLI